MVDSTFGRVSILEGSWRCTPCIQLASIAYDHCLCPNDGCYPLIPSVQEQEQQQQQQQQQCHHPDWSSLILPSIEQQLSALSTIRQDDSWTFLDGSRCMYGGRFIGCVFTSHNDGVSGCIANFYSLHSWIGFLVLTMYLVQLLLGIITFGCPTFFGIRSNPFKRMVFMVHYYFGPTIYLGMTATLLLGIQEKEGFIGCAYKVEAAGGHPDVRFPFIHILQIPLSCRISHLLGLVIGLTGLCTTFALHPIDREDRIGRLNR
jgi:hypothetical protein